MGYAGNEGQAGVKSRRKPTMRKQRAWKVVAPYAAVVTMVLGAGATVVAVNSFDGNASQAPAPSTRSFTAAQSSQAASYWTPKQLASATPLDDKPKAASAHTMSADSSMPTASSFGGTRTVGGLFMRTSSGNHFCTASVIHSAKKNLLLTAAHCLYGSPGNPRDTTNVVFIPGYSNGHMPYGMWAASADYVPAHWYRTSKYGNDYMRDFDPDLDFGFVSVRPNNGVQIESVTGANKLWHYTGSWGNWAKEVRSVVVDGFPSRSSQPIRCWNNAFHPDYRRYTSIYRSKYPYYGEKSMHYMSEFDCKGYYGGTSGSPFIAWVNSRTHTGSVIAVIGGWDRGGDASQLHSAISFASRFDGDVWNLYHSASSQAPTT
jgi:hypothetical protein